METQDQRIERIMELTEETNRIVRGMRNQHRMSSLFRVIYVVAFLYASWWGYQQMLPYLTQLKATYAQINELNKTAQEAKTTSSVELQKLIDSLPATIKPTAK
jgi:hypothetical protein